jgi:hypothetical protein
MKKLKRIVAFIVGWIDLQIIIFFSLGTVPVWSLVVSIILWVWFLWPYLERIDAKYMLEREEKRRRTT